MDEEIKAILKNNTWELATLPKCHKVIGDKWMYKTKRNAKEEIKRHKATLAAKGYSQKDGIDYNQEDFVAKLETFNLNDLANSFQRSICQAAATSTTFKSRILSYKKRLKAENQSLKKDLEQEKEESAKLRTKISTFEEKAAMADSKAFQLEKELSMVRDELLNVRKDLDVQRFSFERTMEAETSRLKSRLDSMGKQLTDEYNNGLTFCYECIMSVLGKEYPELDMAKLEAGVDAYMSEQDVRNQQPRDPTPNMEAAAAGPVEVAPSVEEDPQVAPPSQANDLPTDQSTQAP